MNFCKISLISVSPNQFRVFLFFETSRTSTIGARADGLQERPGVVAVLANPINARSVGQCHRRDAVLANDNVGPLTPCKLYCTPTGARDVCKLVVHFACYEWVVPLDPILRIRMTAANTTQEYLVEEGVKPYLQIYIYI